MSAVLTNAGQPQHRARNGGWRQTVSAALTPVRVETAFWIILCVSLAAGIGLEANWGRQVQGPVPIIAETPAAFSKPALAEPFRLAPPDQYSQMTARPIFIVTRRPAPTAPPPEAIKPSMKKDQFILMGTTIAGASKIAFLVEKAGNKSQVVAEGKEINGIMVKEVKADRIVLSQFGDTEVLVLRTNKPPPGGPARAAGAQGAAPFPGAPPVPAGAQGATPFFGAPPAPAQKSLVDAIQERNAQGATPPPGPPAAPAAAPGSTTAPPDAPAPPAGPAGTPPNRRQANPVFPGFPPFGFPRQ